MQRFLKHHHDGHGLNERIDIRADTKDKLNGGASHNYSIHVDTSGNESRSGNAVLAGSLTFQQGPRYAPASQPGITEAALLAVLMDRLESFQGGPYACAENEAALDHLQLAMVWFKRRADRRAREGKLGTRAV